MNELITKDLANEVRLLWSNLTIDFGEEEVQEIVPIKLTHFYLINNLEIPQIIIDYYYYPTRKLISEKEFIQMVKTGYIGNKNRTLTPYSIKMFGAYFRRTSMYYKLIRLSSKNNDLLINGYEIKYYIDLKPYFKEYAIGFRTGFNDFENDCIKPFLFEFSEKTDITQKIFEFVINNKKIEQCWLNYLVGFTTNYNSKEIVGALKEGKTQGYFYKAWSIIFSNFNLFEPLFMEHKKKAYLSEKTKLNIHKKEPQQEKEYNFENNFDNIKPELVYDYFNKMLVEKKYISEETLQLFLKSAFQEKEKPNQIFKIDNKPTNKKIQDIFYKYYKDIAGKPHGQKRKYVELLGEYFIGFKTDTLMTNFSKTY